MSIPATHLAEISSASNDWLASAAQIKHAQATARLLVCDPGGRELAAEVRDACIHQLRSRGVVVKLKGGRA